MSALLPKADSDLRLVALTYRPPWCALHRYAAATLAPSKGRLMRCTVDGLTPNRSAMTECQADQESPEPHGFVFPAQGLGRHQDRGEVGSACRRRCLRNARLGWEGSRKF